MLDDREYLSPKQWGLTYFLINILRTGESHREWDGPSEVDLSKLACAFPVGQKRIYYVSHRPYGNLLAFPHFTFFSSASPACVWMGRSQPLPQLLAPAARTWKGLVLAGKPVVVPNSTQSFCNSLASFAF